MSEKFNADEVFEIAEQIERNGAEFYRRAADATPVKGTESLLRKLAEMEEVHEKTFSHMRRELQAKHPGWLAEYFDAESESTAAQYLKAVAAGKIFRLDESDEFAFSDIVRVLELAIEREKDSIVFYSAIKRAMPHDLGQEQLDRIIEEEMSHVILLTGYLTEARRG